MNDKKNQSKRNIPNKAELKLRREFLDSIRNKSFDSDYSLAPLLEHGNSKIGINSHIYDQVFVWNLPAVLTCPSASAWCLTNCYNADHRIEKFPLDLWYQNLLFFQQEEIKLEKKLLETLLTPKSKIAVRLHSSGDFFSKAYINFWYRIISKTPNVKYWAYTRSWEKKSLLSDLELMRNLENIQLFASLDETMSKPPSGWRKSIVYDELNENVKGGIVCPEQNGSVPNCATCNYCINKTNGDIYFILH